MRGLAREHTPDEAERWLSKLPRDRRVVVSQRRPVRGATGGRSHGYDEPKLIPARFAPPAHPWPAAIPDTTVAA